MPDTYPDCPADWIVSTALPTHLSLLYGGDGRSVLVCPTEPAATAAEPDAIDAWTVKGLAGYDPTYPIFAEGVTYTEAIETVESVMATIAAGETPSPVRVSERVANVDPVATQSDNEKSEASPEQAALSTFGGDSDDE